MIHPIKEYLEELDRAQDHETFVIYRDSLWHIAICMETHVLLVNPHKVGGSLTVMAHGPAEDSNREVLMPYTETFEIFKYCK